jgi:MFS family permease
MIISLASSRTRPVPAEHRANFNHLVLDIAWFGVLNGSAIAFVAVYAARLGASALQIGLLTALPAIVNMVFALPAGHWLQPRPISRATFAAAAAYRLFYLPWVFLPSLLGAQAQIWAIILITLIMTIPGTALAIGFNSLFAAAVPPEWRAQVVGVRNAAYALVSIVITLICGRILDQLPFPLGYQVVFFIGFIGAAMSTLHLWFVRPLDEHRKPGSGRFSLRDWGHPGVGILEGVRTTVGLRFLASVDLKSLRSSRWLSPCRDNRFARVLLFVFAMHLTLYLAVPIFPLFLVNELAFTDNVIGLGNSIFYIAMFLASTQLNGVTRRFGNQKTMALGIMVISLYPLLISQASGPTLYLVAAVAGGTGWALAGAAVANFVLEQTPDDKRPVYLAWNNIALQAGILLGALVAPTLAGWWGLAAALVFASASRFLTGIVLYRARIERAAVQEQSLP